MVMLTSVTSLMLMFSFGAFAYSFIARVATKNLTMVTMSGVLLAFSVLSHILASALEKRRGRPRGAITSEPTHNGKEEFFFWALLTGSTMMLGASLMAFINWVSKEIDWRMPVVLVSIHIVLTGLFLWHCIKHAAEYGPDKTH